MYSVCPYVQPLIVYKLQRSDLRSEIMTLRHYSDPTSVSVLSCVFFFSKPHPIV